jgi:hypothetical protein
MSDLSDLYQEVILDHNRRPRNWGPMADATRVAHGHNPLCGDRLTLYVKIDGDTLEAISFEGSGCAISKASASLMTDAVKGQKIDDPIDPAGRRHPRRKNGRDVGRARVSRAREVRIAGLAHAQVGHRQSRRNRQDRVEKRRADPRGLRRWGDTRASCDKPAARAP